VGLDAEEVPQPGTLYAFSTVRAAGRTAAVPYRIGYADFPGGLRVCGRLTGHPIGATGVAQVVAVTRHLSGADTGLARPPQVGLTHRTGGGISGYDHAVCSVHLLAAS
jgi:DUF35 OB-fold domain, acyl-CoA-associated